MGEISISGTVTDFFFFLGHRVQVCDFFSRGLQCKIPAHSSPTLLLSAEVVRYNSTVSVIDFISSFDCSGKGLRKSALVLYFLPHYF